MSWGGTIEEFFLFCFKGGDLIGIYLDILSIFLRFSYFLITFDRFSVFFLV